MSKIGRRDKSPSSQPPVREEAPSVADEGEEKFVQKTVIAPVKVVEDVEEHPNSPAAAVSDTQISSIKEADKSHDVSGSNSAPLGEKLQEIKVSVFNDLIEAVDLSQLAALEHSEVREEISDIVSEIIGMRSLVLSAQEQQHVIEDICNDVLGLGPLEPLLARDDIADIMVNGPNQVFIESNGRIELTDIKFRDHAQLMTICQRIVTAVGRRVDEASPICDARLLDGSRVNVIVKPLAVDGAALTIRKFQKEKLTLDNLVEFGSVSPECATVLEFIGASR